MPKLKDQPEGPKERTVKTAKLGHGCPNGCYNGGSAQLFDSKTAPGMLECPWCHEKFEKA